MTSISASYQIYVWKTPCPSYSTRHGFLTQMVSMNGVCMWTSQDNGGCRTGNRCIGLGHWEAPVIATAVWVVMMGGHHMVCIIDGTNRPTWFA